MTRVNINQVKGTPSGTGSIPASYVSIANNQSISSNNYTDLTGLTTTITVSNQIVIFAQANVQWQDNGSGNSIPAIRIVIDTQNGAEIFKENTGISTTNVLTNTFMSTVFPAGTYTVKIQGRAIGGQMVTFVSGELFVFALEAAVGPTGSIGPTGTIGATGIIGPTGSVGATGVIGPTGSQGIQGVQGIQGSPGITGAKGPTGPQGNQGSPGVTGLQGIQGSPGVTGATGPIGPQGVIGGAGSPGPRGATGPTGPPGINAYSTSEGFTQPNIGTTILLRVPSGYWLQVGQRVFIPSGGYYQVASGSVPTFAFLNLGYSGTNIPVGSTVAAAFVSPGGVAGITGVTGPQGAQGSPGVTGAQGIQGSPGITGPAGAGAAGADFAFTYLHMGA